MWGQRLVEPLGRLLMGGRLSVRDLLQVVCLLTVFAVLLNIMESSQNASDIGEAHRKGEITTLATKTLNPTKSPTIVPTQTPTVSPIEPPPPPPQSNRTATTALNWITFIQNNNNNNNKPWKRPPVLPNDHNFAKRWCNFQNNIQWYPSNEQQRDVPRVLIPGAKYAGAQPLAAALHQHTQKPLRGGGFFLDRNFHFVDSDERTNVFHARLRLRASHLYTNNDMVGVDPTSGYFFYSSLVPRRILCVLPWIQLLVVVRNPTDRVLEHYAQQQKMGLKQDLETFVQHDWELLEKAGLVKDNKPVEGSKKQDEAWLNYQDISLTGVLGRSMYSISLRQWCLAMRAAGRDPSKAILIVSADDWKPNNHQAKYRSVQAFLGLQQQQGVKPPTYLVRPPRVTIDASLRKRLDALFAPYSKKLASLIQEYKLNVV